MAYVTVRLQLMQNTAVYAPITFEQIVMVMIKIVINLFEVVSFHADLEKSEEKFKKLSSHIP